MNTNDLILGGTILAASLGLIYYSQKLDVEDKTKKPKKKKIKIIEESEEVSEDKKEVSFSEDKKEIPEIRRGALKDEL